MNPIETEVKFFINDVDALKNEINQLGATTQGRFFEKNIRYEDKGRNLIKRKCLLRLRQDKNTTLTFKSPPLPHDKKLDDKEFKVNQELEVVVSDFHTMHRILAELGFHQEQVYEKWRETLILDKAVLCIDQMPFGTFLEIESDKTTIKTLANKLNLKWDKRIVFNYLSMFEIIKKKAELKFSDVTFGHFSSCHMDFKDFQGLFEAG